MSQALAALAPVLGVGVIVAFLGIVLMFVVSLRSRANRAQLPNTPLAVKPSSLMTDAERAFFHTLQNAIANRYLIFPQIELQSIVKQTGNLSPNVWGILKNSRVDFVLAHAKFLAPILVIELDDSSHTQATTQSRDKIKERILRDAKIPLLRFRVGDAWSAEDIRTRTDQVTDFKKDGMATNSSQCSSA